MMKTKPRVRYVVNPNATHDDAISNFCLLATPFREHCTSIRVELPDDLVLEKLKHDHYSTTEDARTLRDLNAAPVVRFNGRWHRMPELWTIGVPEDWKRDIITRGFVETNHGRGFLTPRQFAYYYDTRPYEAPKKGD